jgi:hypothetical protein
MVGDGFTPRDGDLKVIEEREERREGGFHPTDKGAGGEIGDIDRRHLRVIVLQSPINNPTKGGVAYGTDLTTGAVQLARGK